MPFSRPRVFTASTISADMVSVSHEIRTVDVGVGDRDDAAVRSHGHRVVGRVDEFAGEGPGGGGGSLAARTDLRPPAEIAAEVLGLGERALRPRARDLERVLLP